MTKDEITIAVENLKKIRKQFNKYEFTHSIDLAIDALCGAVDGIYPCDGLGCKRMCAKTMTVSEWEQYNCHHTTDPEHAVSKFNPEHHIQVAEVLGIRKEAENDPIRKLTTS